MTDRRDDIVSISGIKPFVVVALSEMNCRPFHPFARQYKGRNVCIHTGGIACADLETSDCEVDDPDGVEFNSLVIDEGRAGGALFFRPHEAPNGIVVYESVRKVLAPLDLRGIVFVKPEDWIG